MGAHGEIVPPCATWPHALAQQLLDALPLVGLVRRTTRKNGGSRIEDRQGDGPLQGWLGRGCKVEVRDRALQFDGEGKAEFVGRRDRRGGTAGSAAASPQRERRPRQARRASHGAEGLDGKPDRRVCYRGRRLAGRERAARLRREVDPFPCPSPHRGGAGGSETACSFFAITTNPPASGHSGEQP